MGVRGLPTTLEEIAKAEADEIKASQGFVISITAQWKGETIHASAMEITPEATNRDAIAASMVMLFKSFTKGLNDALDTETNPLSA